MKKIELIQKDLIARLDKLIQNQYLLRLEIIGRKISSVFYHYEPGKKDIHIPDMKILHLPMGCLWIKTDNGNIYKIVTSYLYWNKLDHGILLERVDANRLSIDFKSAINRSKLSCWRPLLDNKITIAEWNWKGGHKLVQEKNRIISRSYMLDQVLKEGLYPEKITLHFENMKKLYIIAADPDEIIPGTKKYNLISAGQEIMVFFCQNKLKDWGLSNPGFEINVTDS